MFAFLADSHRRHLLLTLAVGAGLVAYVTGAVRSVYDFDLAMLLALIGGFPTYSGADKEKTVILAQAYAEAEIVRGKAEAQATRTYSEAHQKDPQFFELLRTLETYKKIFDEKTTILLSGDSELLKSSRHPLRPALGRRSCDPAQGVRAEAGRHRLEPRRSQSGASRRARRGMPGGRSESDYDLGHRAVRHPRCEGVYGSTRPTRSSRPSPTERRVRHRRFRDRAASQKLKSGETEPVSFRPNVSRSSCDDSLLASGVDFLAGRVDPGSPGAGSERLCRQGGSGAHRRRTS